MGHHITLELLNLFKAFELAPQRYNAHIQRLHFDHGHTTTIMVYDQLLCETTDREVLVINTLSELGRKNES